MTLARDEQGPSTPGTACPAYLTKSGGGGPDNAAG